MKSAARGSSPLRGGRRRRQAGAEHGTTIVEAALALPLFFLLVLGTIWFGLAFSSYQALVTAAREGARYGVAPLANANYNLPTNNEIAQRSCNYLQSAVLGGLAQCSNYGGSTPPAITGCNDPALKTADNIYVGVVPVPYTIQYIGSPGTSTLNQTDVVVGIRKTVPIMGFTLHLTTCSAMRSENN
ncbi:MAG TPA: TadE/TadG family type IV pilus assembly protein [Terriglobales bacterium]|jgi:Flp pilus assembly protein TadG